MLTALWIQFRWDPDPKNIVPDPSFLTEKNGTIWTLYTSIW
jgi:hypothetical protein